MASQHRVNHFTLWFLRFSRAMVRLYGTLWHGIRIEGREYIPRTGAGIVVCNHQSHLDPALVGSYSPRPMHFLAKDELFRVPFLGLFLSWMGMVPTPRDGGASGAMRAGIRVLKEHHLLGIFPEGKRSRSGERLPAQPGVVALAVLGGPVPIIPAYIEGSYEAMPPGRKLPVFRAPITIRYGPPFELTADECNLKDKEKLQATAERIMDHIFVLKGGDK